MDKKTPSKKVLFTSHTANFSKFNRPFMRWFSEQGYEVHYASAGEEEVLDCDRHFTVSFNRSPWSFDNIRAYRQLKKVIARENYALIHTHTPMGSVVTRLAARKERKKGTKVIYTAHGFHFYKGAPLLNWLLYYPIEKLLAKYTDVLIAINNEDYSRAKHNFNTAGSVQKIDGVGVDLGRFKPVNLQEKHLLRKKHGYSDDDFILICVAEFTANKNHEFIIRAAVDLQKTIPSQKILLLGKGGRLNKAKELSSTLGLDGVVKFLGYRTDIADIVSLSDVLVSASFREGLPVSVIEAMASGLPAVATRIRGHTDAIKDGRNGYLYELYDASSFVEIIQNLYRDQSLRKDISTSNIVDAQRFSLDNSIRSMAKIYKATV